MTVTVERCSRDADWDFRPCSASTMPARTIARIRARVSTSTPNQIEVITAEQMLDAYSSVGHAAVSTSTGHSASISPIRRRCIARD